MNENNADFTTTTNKAVVETLRLAGKAIGEVINYSDNCGDFCIGEPYNGEKDWNPLVSNEDAFNLAVKLGIFLRSDFIKYLSEALARKNDREQATRLAITFIAARIGELNDESQLTRSNCKAKH